MNDYGWGDEFDAKRAARDLMEIVNKCMAKECLTVWGPV